MKRIIALVIAPLLASCTARSVGTSRELLDARNAYARAAAIQGGPALVAVVAALIAAN